MSHGTHPKTFREIGINKALIVIIIVYVVTILLLLLLISLLPNITIIISHVFKSGLHKAIFLIRKGKKVQICTCKKLKLKVFTSNNFVALLLTSLSCNDFRTQNVTIHNALRVPMFVLLLHVSFGTALFAFPAVICS